MEKTILADSLVLTKAKGLKLIQKDQGLLVISPEKRTFLLLKGDELKVFTLVTNVTLGQLRSLGNFSPDFLQKTVKKLFFFYLIALGGRTYEGAISKATRVKLPLDLPLGLRSKDTKSEFFKQLCSLLDKASEYLTTKVNASACKFSPEIIIALNDTYNKSLINQDKVAEPFDNPAIIEEILHFAHEHIKNVFPGQINLKLVINTKGLPKDWDYKAQSNIDFLTLLGRLNTEVFYHSCNLPKAKASLEDLLLKSSLFSNSAFVKCKDEGEVNQSITLSKELKEYADILGPRIVYLSHYGISVLPCFKVEKGEDILQFANICAFIGCTTVSYVLPGLDIGPSYFKNFDEYDNYLKWVKASFIYLADNPYYRVLYGKQHLTVWPLEHIKTYYSLSNRTGNNKITKIDLEDNVPGRTLPPCSKCFCCGFCRLKDPSVKENCAFWKELTGEILWRSV